MKKETVKLRMSDVYKRFKISQKFMEIELLLDADVKIIVFTEKKLRI